MKLRASPSIHQVDRASTLVTVTRWHDVPAGPSFYRALYF